MQFSISQLSRRNLIYISTFIILLGILFVVIFNKPNIEPAHTEVVPTASDISVLNPPEQSEISLEQISSSTHPSTTEPVASTSPTAVVQSKKESTPKVTLPPEPKAVPKTNTATHSSIFLDRHNAVRTTHDLPALTWSPTLAKEAQAWSGVLKSESCQMRHDYTTEHGENIYWEKQSGGDTSELISSPADAVYYWAEEKKYFDYKTNSCATGEVCGHYTQLVWADTTTVGCGVSSCLEGESRTDIWVCRYDPAGNIVGDKPY
jgi:hypothetical protein